MNILMIPSWYENSNNKTLGSFFREQAEGLEKLGHKVYVLYVDIIRFNEIKRMMNTSKLDYYEKNNLKVYRIKKIKFPKTKEKYVYKMVRKGIEQLYLENIHGKIKINVIHAHSFIWAGYAGVMLSKKYDIPIMVTEHYTGYARNIFSNEEKEIINYSITNSDKVVAVSSGLKNDMLKYVQGNNSIEVIPNMVDTSIFTPDFSKIITNKEFRFLSVCYLMHKKGIDILLKAFKKAFNNNKNVKLVIGGDGEEKENLIKLAKQLLIEDQVEFLGLIDRNTVVDEMKKCNCFVLPSRYETFGVVYIEALAMGKPIIATDTDAINDIIDENNGLIVERNNEEKLVEALINMKDKYKKYNAKSISENCINKFGKVNIAKKINNSLLDSIYIHEVKSKRR